MRLSRAPTGALTCVALAGAAALVPALGGCSTPPPAVPGPGPQLAPAPAPSAAASIAGPAFGSPPSVEYGLDPPPGLPGPVVRIGDMLLAIGVCADNIIRVAYARDLAFFARPTLATLERRCPKTTFQTESNSGRGELTVRTAELTVHVDTRSGAVSFRDAADRTILAERVSGRTLTPAIVQGESTQNVRQQWEPNGDEGLYGLGQHQQGWMNIKDIDLDLRQSNTEIAVPFLVSSRGYGILWDNTSFTRFGDLGAAVPLPGVAGLYAPADSGLPGDIAATGAVVDWTGTVTPSASGDALLRTYSTGEIKLWVDDQLVIDHWRQDWLPNEDVARVPVSAHQPVRIHLKWTREGNSTVARLLWKPPVADRTTSLWSEVGDGVDYTFVQGPSLDRVIAGYRQLTGEAPMMPRWAFGLWQSRERYRTQKESLDVVAGFRARHIPFDNIVQDWQYWPPGTWGSHEFDTTRFEDPTGWIRALHEQHAHVMISVWPRFYPGTANFEALKAAGLLYKSNLTEGLRDFLHNVFTVYDAFNPEARRLYWSQINQQLFSRGIDAWWMDSSEPEMVQGPFVSIAAQVQGNETHMNPTSAGSGARVLNAFPLVNSEAIYEGQRAAAPDQRVFELTRSGFAGQQRYATASWSGDITSTWTAMRKQIPAGLGFALSGVPYWTLDCGGFVVPSRYVVKPTPEDLDEWRELNTRWFEYATFLPILRVHGQAPRREMWEFGGDASPAYQAQLKFDRLRYRLLPYLYSLAGAVTQRSGTILRPLVMDFGADARARDIGDEYMFGPALLVSPVVTYKARARDVYLPTTAGGWYSLWTGAAAPAGSMSAPAPFDAIPVYVRAGSIVPFGPELQYTNEKPADPITVFVYTGADGVFTLYEDDGASYGYEHGMFARIELRWDEARRTLTIGERQGSFPGMLEHRTLRVVFVSPHRLVPFSFQPAIDKTVRYDGRTIEIPLAAAPMR